MDTEQQKKETKDTYADLIWLEADLRKQMERYPADDPSDAAHFLFNAHENALNALNNYRKALKALGLL